VLRIGLGSSGSEQTFNVYLILTKWLQYCQDGTGTDDAIVPSIVYVVIYAILSM